MADHSSIEWTDATWNPITGCSIVSPGCTHCYAMTLAGTRLRHHPSRAGLTIDTKAGPVWNGEVRLNTEWLTQPLHWRRPRMIFVGAHGDLFHESVPDAWIDRVFAVMALAPQHTFQVLTKRSARLRAYFDGRRAAFGRASDALLELSHGLSEAAHDAAVDRLDYFDSAGIAQRNIWLGVSAEDQQRADERVPDLLATPAAIRFVSAEPLLGPLDFTRILAPNRLSYWDALTGRRWNESGELFGFPRLDWIIVGGENGPRAMHPDWARAIRDQCAPTTVAFHFKQWGSFSPTAISRERFLSPLPEHEGERIAAAGGEFTTIPGEPDVVVMRRVGKKAAGRLLDGIEHNGMPEARV